MLLPCCSGSLGLEADPATSDKSPCQSQSTLQRETREQVSSQLSFSPQQYFLSALLDRDLFLFLSSAGSPRAPHYVWAPKEPGEGDEKSRSKALQQAELLHLPFISACFAALTTFLREIFVAAVSFGSFSGRSG